MTDEELNIAAWNLARKRRGYCTFKAHARNFQAIHPQFKVSYSEVTVSPICSCPLEDCQHLTILNIFENEGINFWDESNSDATNHPYWVRLRNYKKSVREIRMKIKGFYDLYHHIKGSTYINNLSLRPAFLVDLDIFSKFNSDCPHGRKMTKYFDDWRNKYGHLAECETIYHRHDGHHRSDIMKFLGRKLPVMVAKLEF